MSYTEHIAEAERILRDVCSDIGSHSPVYIVVTQPRDLLTPFLNACGFHRPGLDLTLRDRLEKEGRWWGRGFATVLNGPQLSRTLDRLMRAKRSDLFGEVFTGLVLHEAAHWLADSSRLNSAAITDLKEADQKTASLSSVVLSLMAGEREYKRFIQSARLQRRAAKRGVTHTPSNTRPQWHQHEGQWIRACGHLYWRTWERHFAMPHQFVANTVGYGLSPLTSYAIAMRDEIHNRINDPIRSILSEPLPPKFDELWSKDTSSWRQRDAS
jgi:hypothetical protein